MSMQHEAAGCCSGVCTSRLQLAVLSAVHLLSAQLRVFILHMQTQAAMAFAMYQQLQAHTRSIAQPGCLRCVFASSCD